MTASTTLPLFDLSRVSCGTITLNVATIGSGPPVIFLHGFPEHWRAFAPMMAALSDQFTCVAPDQRGYGNSDRPSATQDYHIDHLADDIASLIAARGDEKVHLVAHDWGGLVAWHFATRHCDLLYKMVIFNAPHPYCLQRALDTDPRQRAASRYARDFAQDGSDVPLLARGAPALWDAFFGADQQRGWLNENDRATQMAAWDQIGAWEAMLNWYRAADFDYNGDPVVMRTRPSPIRTPTLLMWGDHDTLFEPSVLSGLDELAPNCRIEIIAGGGHCVFREDLAACTARVREFLARTERREDNGLT